MSSRSLRHRIQAVVELTGVSAATLRSWERRYGVPIPQRSASAYRLYSDDDVELIKALRRFVEQGVPASEAARRVRVSTAPSLIETEIVDPFAAAESRLVDAVDAFDTEGIGEAIDAALTLGPASTVYERVVRPTLVRIGEMWEQGKLSVAQEHLASQMLETCLRNLLRLVLSVDASRSVVLACFGHEEHTFPLYGVGLRFAGWGYRVTVLGARTPPEAVASAVARLRPDVVGLSVTTPLPRLEAERLTRAYGDACGGTVWVVGGAGTASLGGVVATAGGVAFTAADVGALRAPLERTLRLGRAASE
jgi:DNA-binding transcriptional MerR regulator/methylmalonyl-CoA mutase cobalamin-binding subunit